MRMAVNDIFATAFQLTYQPWCDASVHPRKSIPFSNDSNVLEYVWQCQNRATNH